MTVPLAPRIFALYPHGQRVVVLVSVVGPVGGLVVPLEHVGGVHAKELAGQSDRGPVGSAIVIGNAEAAPSVNATTPPDKMATAAIVAVKRVRYRFRMVRGLVLIGFSSCSCTAVVRRTRAGGPPRRYIDFRRATNPRLVDQPRTTLPRYEQTEVNGWAFGRPVDVGWLPWYPSVQLQPTANGRQIIPVVRDRETVDFQE